MTAVSSLFSQLDATSRTGVDSATNLAEDFSNFLNLLTVQLQNQDPLEPLDTNQFTEQIVQMTQVEQTVSMNQRLGALIDAQETQRIQGAVDFVGKHADALGNAAPLTADGADMFYALSAPATTVAADIVDLSRDGKIVRQFDAPPTQAGVNRIHWDGLDGDGKPVDPTGDYRMRVAAFTAGGEEMATTTGFSGLVEELRHADGALAFSIGGRIVAMDQIVAARAPKPQSAADE